MMTATVTTRMRPETAEVEHGVFKLLIVLKGLNGTLELVGGAALLFLQTGAIMAWIEVLTKHELSEDPNDLLAQLLTHWASSFGHDRQMFVAGYLLFHGVAKTILVTLLLLGKNWAYPVAIMFFLSFVAYAALRLSHAWSWPLAGLLVLDLATTWLTAEEWKKKRVRAAKSRLTATFLRT
jgi:uncharacterized membrane protein